MKPITDPRTPSPPPSRSLNWSRFAAEAQLDLALFAAAVTGLQALRVLFVLFFRTGLSPETGTATVLRALRGGLGFDAQVAFYVAAPGLLASFACAFTDASGAARRIRLTAGSLFAGLLPLLAAISIAYIREYGDLFNHFIFGAIYDDFGAVLQTVWNENHVVWQLGASALLGWALVRMARRWLRRPWLEEASLASRVRHPALRIAATAAFVVLLAVAARGGVGRVPLQARDRDVTRDEFLNRLVLNPYSALRYAIHDHRKLTGRKGAREVLGSKGIRGAVEEVFPDRPIGTDLDELFLRKAHGPKGRPPRHVFLIVMESYDAWPLLEPYRQLHLLDECARLASGGILVRSFVSGSSGTGTSLSVLITGLHDTEVPTIYEPNSRKTYATATAAAFRRLGYRTRLFYGGYVSWQRLGDFAKDQGFDEAYGRAHIPHPRQINEWGVDDQSLFELVLSKTNDDTPSFNLIMTTNNHPPYNFDLPSVGWTPRSLLPELARLSDGHLTDAMMGHLWWSDRCMGRFVNEASKRLGRPLFAVTGDHFSRKFLNQRPDLYEGSAVPLLLYGPEALAGVKVPERMAGSHIDLPPTLIELCAPAGFSYHSLGGDILDPEREAVGLGRWTILGPDFIAELRSDRPAEPLPWVDRIAEPPDLARLRARFRNLIGVSWWRIMRGSGVPSGEP